eukprot:scaffold45218_cov61-Phaeocystis_antarctica.AAC.13
MRRLLSEPGWRRCCGVGFVSFHSKVDPLQIFEQAAYLLTMARLTVATATLTMARLTMGVRTVARLTMATLTMAMLTVATLTMAMLTLALSTTDRARQAAAAAEQRGRRVQCTAPPACLAPARTIGCALGEPAVLAPAVRVATAAGDPDHVRREHGGHRPHRRLQLRLASLPAWLRPGRGHRHHLHHHRLPPRLHPGAAPREHLLRLYLLWLYLLRLYLLWLYSPGAALREYHHAAQVLQPEGGLYRAQARVLPGEG